MKAEWMAQNWLIPCDAVGAVIVGSWLVEAKQSVIENMAPVLTRLLFEDKKAIGKRRTWLSPPAQPEPAPTPELVGLDAPFSPFTVPP